MEVLLLALVLAMVMAGNILCFLIGVKVGRSVHSDKDIKVPTINPLKAYRDNQMQKESEREQKWHDTVMRNIENYDGTSAGQMDVPEVR